MGFKEQVEQILSQRKVFLEKINRDKEKVSAIQADFYKIKDDLDKIGSNGINADAIRPELEQAIRKIDNAVEMIDRMRKRFGRGTVNIGVAGPARVGKSTFLQSLTGLGDEQIPSGSGSPVTAVRSQIFNLSHGSESYALIEFFDEQEFIKNRVAPYTELIKDELKSGIYSIADLENCVLPTQISGDNNVRKNTAIEKLNNFKESLDSYRDLISHDPVKKSLSELRSYVAYPKPGTNAPSKYVAVKNVEIYCNFPSLDDVKLQVIDLPGFGEIGAVDKVQIDGLETQVDHAMLILRPEEQEAFIGERYANIANTLLSVQKEVKKRSNLMSVILNKDNRDCVEELANNLKNELLRRDSNVSMENLYEVNARNKDAVGKVLTKILDRMLSALPEMDQDFLNAYKAAIDFKSIKEQLITVQEKVRNLRKSSPTERKTISTTAKNLKRELNKIFKKILETKKGTLNDRINQAITDICNSVKGKIENDLMFESTEDYPSWTEWAELVDTNNDVKDIYPRECHRLRIAILDEYETLDKVYSDLTEELKTELMSVFKEQTGTLLDKDTNGSATIKEIRNKLKNSDANIASFEKAFEWLDTQQMNFRQNVYPILYSGEDIQWLNSTKHPIPTNDFPEDPKEQREFVKRMLTDNAKTFNNSIKNSACENNYAGSFLDCVTENFADLLIRRDEDMADEDFADFVEQFKDDIFPSEDLSKVERDALNNLAVAIKRVIAEIDELEV